MMVHHVNTFSAALVSLVPDAIKGDVQKISVDPALADLGRNQRGRCAPSPSPEA